jgi:hypothetical protein
MPQSASSDATKATNTPYHDWTIKQVSASQLSSSYTRTLSSSILGKAATQPSIGDTFTCFGLHRPGSHTVLQATMHASHRVAYSPLADVATRLLTRNIPDANILPLAESGGGVSVYQQVVPAYQ